ncbi:VG15 protein [Kineococcus esterisolvens]|uniref:VG15 protein n=1 Tax=unclassified Kineococcus TaxID=2621656 RepID=UPI003D7CC178
MPATTERAAEAARAEVAFQVALAQIGAVTIAEALKLWGAVPATGGASVRRAWLRRAVALVAQRRTRARTLAIAYYRLVRALRTGYTIRDPGRPDEGEAVTLDDLREQWEDAQRQARQGASRASSGSTPTPSTPEPEQATSEAPAPADEALDDGADAEADRILIEELEGIEREAERLEREAQREAQLLLDELGTQNLDRKVEDIDTDAPATEVDAARRDAHNRAGTRQAAAAERMAMDGGRGWVWSAAERDKRAIGYVRLSRTGTPCGWCAMLISRGAVYKTARGAEYVDGDKYHDNCHCYAQPVFSREQFGGDALYALNRRYAEEWPRVTRGLSGKSAVSAWRHYIRQEQRRAQAARSTTTSVQEA